MHPKTVGHYLSVKRTVSLLLLIFACFLMVGCSKPGSAEDAEAVKTNDSDDKNKEAIQAVIKKEFTGQDKKFKELWDAAMEAQQPDMSQEEYDAFMESPAYKNLTAYMEDTYATYFTENGYDNFINAAPAFMYSGFEGDYKLTASDIEINQSENGPTLYDFTFQVTYENENKETNSFNFEGKAIVPEAGKIGKIQFNDKDGLLIKMNEENFN